jgi:Mrp family chromosome partitioning ATPase/uncharacterized protein involved in exopolysaccharide biosynthesis
MDFVYFFRVLFKRKWLIIGSGILAGVIAFILVRKEPKSYLSSTQISTGFTIKDAIEVKDENISFFEAESKFSNVILIMKSAAVNGLLSYRLLLHDLEDPHPFRVPGKPKKHTGPAPKLDKTAMEKLLNEKINNLGLLNAFVPEEKEVLDLLDRYDYDYNSLSDDLKIARLQRTDYLQIDFSSENPELSAFVVNELYKQFLRYYTRVRDTRSMESIDTLKSIMDKKKTALDAKKAILMGEGAPDVEMENSNRLERITNLEKNLTDEKSRRTTLYYSLKKINQRLGVPVDGQAQVNDVKDINSNSELLTLKSVMNNTYEAYVNTGSTDKTLLNKYNQLKTEYQAKFAQLSETYANNATSANPNGPSASSKAELLQQKNDINIDIEASEANIASIQSSIDKLKGNVTEGATKAASVETLMKEVDLANKEYLDAKQKYSDAIDIGSSFVNNFRQILPGQIPSEAQPSKKLLVVGLSCVAASLTCALIIILLTYLDSSVKTPGIFAKTVNLKLISLVNFMNLKKKSLWDIIGDRAIIESSLDKRRHNQFRESLRKLRYEIESSGKKIFLFTSTKKGEGKTTLIQALSYSLSLSQKKILIIDTNFCNNDLTVQMNAAPILEKLGAAGNDYQTLLDNVRKATTLVGTSSVFIIGSEGGDYTPSEILPSGNLLQYLSDLTKEYDYIFLEGPPLNDYSDSRELVAYVEGVIAVFSANHIIKQIDKESISFFRNLNGKFYGSVLNMVEMENLNVT